MCITKKELESKVQELRSLKAMKEELENELKAVEHSIIGYMTENGIDTEITATAKITYKPQSRTTLDKEKLADILGDDLKPFEKVSTFNVLRVKWKWKIDQTLKRKCIMSPSLTTYSLPSTAILPASRTGVSPPRVT